MPSVDHLGRAEGAGVLSQFDAEGCVGLGRGRYHRRVIAEMELCVMTANTVELDLSAPSPEDTMESTSYIETIEAVLTSLDQGDGPRVQKNSDGHLWTFKYGSVNVYVQLTGETVSDTLTVWSPVLTLPAKDEPRLMKHLLEKNCYETLEARFGLSGDQVLVISSRILQDISATEISRLMTIVATIADDTDDALQAEFGQN
jgi:hypothetical protein